MVLEEVFANDAASSELIYKICKQLIQLNVKKNKQLNQINRKPKRHFSKEDI